MEFLHIHPQRVGIHQPVLIMLLKHSRNTEREKELN